jgi:hypothetical protein
MSRTFKGITQIIPVFVVRTRSVTVPLVNDARTVNVDRAIVLPSRHSPSVASVPVHVPMNAALGSWRVPQPRGPRARIRTNRFMDVSILGEPSDSNRGSGVDRGLDRDNGCSHGPP